jgi:hypothetical protein
MRSAHPGEHRKMHANVCLRADEILKQAERHRANEFSGEINRSPRRLNRWINRPVDAAIECAARSISPANTSEKREKAMSRCAVALLAGVLTAAAMPAWAQAPAPPMFSTTKVEGTDGVYIFRYRHRPDRRTAPGSSRLHRRDPQDHSGADQVRRLQPQPLRPHCGRQAVQGSRRCLCRPQECQGAAGRAQGAGYRHPGSGRRRQRRQA